MYRTRMASFFSLLTALAFFPLGAAKLREVKDYFLAADPGMRSASTNHGTGASSWGIWRVDPGPRVVDISKNNPNALDELMSSKIAPAGWEFDPEMWWLDENGDVMEEPVVVPEGRYKVVWFNDVSYYKDGVLLTIDGDYWNLERGHTLQQVTNMPCRSAMYTGCSPRAIDMRKFPVPPGGSMPEVRGCLKTEYAILRVIQVEETEDFMPRGRAELASMVDQCLSDRR